jgi:hypothetical protein
LCDMAKSTEITLRLAFLRSKKTRTPADLLLTEGHTLLPIWRGRG